MRPFDELTCEEREELEASFMDMLGIRKLGIGKPISRPRTVFRIELPNGRGPYNTGRADQQETYKAICNGGKGFNCAALARKNREQCGYTDRAFYRAHNGQMRYACDSLSAVKEWFAEPSRRYLREKLQAELAVYRLPVGTDVLEVGNGEIIFDPRPAKKIASKDVVTFQ